MPFFVNKLIAQFADMEESMKLLCISNARNNVLVLKLGSTNIDKYGYFLLLKNNYLFKPLKKLKNSGILRKRELEKTNKTRRRRTRYQVTVIF
jgi:hypothetical protein